MALFKKNKETKEKAPSSDASKKKDSSIQNLDWVLQKTRITEKTAVQMENNQYTFLVHTDANRAQVKQAVSLAYKVNPIKVNIMVRATRTKNSRGRKVMDRGYKKAIVKLPANESIELV